MTKFLFGADPELFLTKGGSFVSAETKNGPIIPGTKQEPFRVKGGAIQVDGVACEFNIDPSPDMSGFITNIVDVVGEMKRRIKEYDPELVLTPVPTATFSERYFKELPDHTRELGCEPDYSAYTMKPNPRPQTDKPFRTGSGHLHFGWTKDQDPYSEGHMLDCQMVVTELDKYLYPVSEDWDKDKERQSLYGKPGSFRPKSFGVEYRPLSNRWLASGETIVRVFTIANAVIRSLDSGTHQFDFEPKWPKTNRYEYCCRTPIGRYM